MNRHFARLCLERRVTPIQLLWHVEDLMDAEKGGEHLTPLDRLFIVAVVLELAEDDPEDTALRELRNGASSYVLQRLLEECDAEVAKEPPVDTSLTTQNDSQK